jgi:hypothetical protein
MENSWKVAKWEIKRNLKNKSFIYLIFLYCDEDFGRQSWQSTAESIAPPVAIHFSRKIMEQSHSQTALIGSSSSAAAPPCPQALHTATHKLLALVELGRSGVVADLKDLDGPGDNSSASSDPPGDRMQCAILVKLNKLCRALGQQDMRSQSTLPILAGMAIIRRRKFHRQCKPPLVEKIVKIPSKEEQVPLIIDGIELVEAANVPDGNRAS